MSSEESGERKYNRDFFAGVFRFQVFRSFSAVHIYSYYMFSFYNLALVQLFNFLFVLTLVAADAIRKRLSAHSCAACGPRIQASRNSIRPWKQESNGLGSGHLWPPGRVRA